MAKFQPIGLDWMNKGLKKFNKDILEAGKLMSRSANDIEKMTLSMKNLNKETGEWVKYTADVVAGAEGVATSFTTTTREIDKLGNVIQTTDKSTKVIEGTIKKAGGSFSFLTGIISGLTAAIGLFLLNALKNLIKFGLKAVVQALILPIKGFIALGKAIVNISFAGFKAGAELAKNVLIGIGEAALWVTKTMIDVGLQIARSMLRISTTMLKAGIDIEGAFAGVAKAATNVVDAEGNLTKTGERVRQQLLDLATVTPLPIEDITRIEELGAQLNVADEQLNEFARVISAVVASTVLSAEMAALGFGKIATVMGIADDEFERMGSTIVWLGNNMGIVEDDLILLAQRITGVSKIAGITTDELFGISAAILRLGATPYAGASAFTQFVTKVIPAMRLGTEEGEIFAATAGLSSDAFVEAWDRDPASTFLNFVIGLSQAGDDAIVILDELGLANIRTSQAFLSLGKSPELLLEAMAGAKIAWRDNTALTREAAIRYATVESQIQMLKNQVDILGDTFFRFLRPIMIEVIDIGGKLAEMIGGIMVAAFKKLEPVIEGAADWFSNIVSAIAPKGFLGVINEMFRTAKEDISSNARDLLTLDYIDLEGAGSTGRWRIESALRNVFDVRFGRIPRGGSPIQPLIDNLFDFEVPDDISERFLDLSRIEEGIPDFSGVEDRLLPLNRLFDLRLIEIPEVTSVQEKISGRFLSLSDSFRLGVSAVKTVVTTQLSDLGGFFDLRIDVPEIDVREDVAENLIRRFGLEFDPGELTKAFEDNVEELQDDTEDIIQGMFKDTQRIKIGARRQAIAEAFEEMYGFDMKKLTSLPSIVQRIIIAVHDLTGIEYKQLFGLIDIWDRVRTGISSWLGSLDFTGVGDMISDSVGRAIQWFLDNWPKIEKAGTDVINAILDYDWAGLWNTITTAAGDVIGWFTDHWEPDIKPAILAAFNWVTNYDWAKLWKTVTDSGQLVIDWFVENWPKIKATVIGTYNEIVDFLFGPKIQDMPGLPPILGMEEEERIGGFIDGLIAGFDNFQESIRITADRIENELIPAIKDLITNIALMLGAEGDIAKDPYLAGEFIITKLGELIETYERIYTGIFNILALMTMQEMPVGPTGEQIPAGFPHGRQQTWEEFGSGFTDPWQEFEAVVETPEAYKAMWSGIWESIQTSMTAPLGEARQEYSTFTSDIENETERFGNVMVYDSLFPDMMDAIVAVFETGLTDISTLWSTFWTGLVGETGFGVDTAMNALGVEQGGSSTGLLATIERSYNSFKEAGRGIVRAIADGMIEAAYMMVDALRANIDGMNVAVDSDEGMNKVLEEIGIKIVTKIANAIIKSMYIIAEALEWAMALAGGLINAANATANNIRNPSGGTVGDVVDSAQGTVSDTAGAVTAPAGGYGYGASYTPVGLPQPQAQGETAQVNINVGSVRSDMDLASLEHTVRGVIAEEFA